MKPQHFTIHSPNEYEISCMEWLPDTATNADRPEAAGAADADRPGAASGPLPTLLCLHGFAGDKYSTVIEAVAKDRCRAGFRCVTFDWPGHGDSTADSSMLTIENCLADLDAVVKRLRPAATAVPSGSTPAPLFCFATSFGGYLAMLDYRRHPEHFARILLRSPALRMGKVLRSFLDEDHMRRFQGGEALNFGFERPLFLHYDFLEDLETPDHDAFRALDGIGCGPASALIAIIHGDADDVVPVTDSLRFAGENDLRIRIVKGADHRYKKPGELEQIIDFAAEIFPAGAR